MQPQHHLEDGGTAAAAAAAASPSSSSSPAAVFLPETSKRRSLNLESLSPTAQFVVLAGGVFFFFGVHNLLQEAIMAVPGFEYGVMLGFMEVLGVTLCSFVERRFVVRERNRVAPFSAYPLLAFCLLTSSSLSNIALNYINFPTKVVFRSCKLIPTMLVASVVNKRVFTCAEYACAVAVCVGLVMFAAADWELTPSFNPIGLALVSASVCADAILPNAQERLFRMGASRLEVTFYTNIFTLLVMIGSTLLSGDLLGALHQVLINRTLATYFAVYTFIAYLAISVHMSVVKRFGGVTAVLVATGRKGMTLVLSFILFPKAFSWFYPVGALLVLGGLTASSLLRIRQKQQQKSSTGNGGSQDHHQRLKHHESGADNYQDGDDDDNNQQMTLPLVAKQRRQR